jgi:hypothetical protein
MRPAAAAISLSWLTEASLMPSTSRSRASGAWTTSANEPNLLEQRFRERLGVAARDRREQRHFQELVIAQRGRPRAKETLAQALTVAVIMRLLGGRGRIFWGQAAWRA